MPSARRIARATFSIVIEEEQQAKCPAKSLLCPMSGLLARPFVLVVQVLRSRAGSRLREKKNGQVQTDTPSA